MKNLLLILLLFLSWGTTYAINIFSMDFSSDTTSAFSAAGDTGDMTLSWNSTEGALSIKGVNSADNIGKAYIGLANFAVPPLSAEDVTITYDLKYDGPMANAAIHFLSGNPGAAFFQALDLHTQGIMKIHGLHLNTLSQALPLGIQVFKHSSKLLQVPSQVLAALFLLITLLFLKFLSLAHML
jgi:hypothetical protein